MILFMNKSLPILLKRHFNKTDSSNLNSKLKILKNAKKICLLGPMKISKKIISKVTKNSDFIIQVDCLHILNDEKTLTLGDGDSVSKTNREKFDYLFPEEKNFSDFEAALHLIKSISRPKHIILHGFWGGRFDHALLIPCQITEHLLQCTNTKIATLYSNNTFESLMILNKGVHHFNEEIFFSLISTKKQSLNLNGKLKYKGKKILQAWSGLGISNMSFGPWKIKCELPIWKYILSNVPNDSN